MQRDYGHYLEDVALQSSCLWKIIEPGCCGLPGSLQAKPAAFPTLNGASRDLSELDSRHVRGLEGPRPKGLQGSRSPNLLRGFEPEISAAWIGGRCLVAVW